MKWILIVLGVLVALVLIVVVVGALLPKAHVASRSARLKASPEQVWAAITTPQRAEVLPPRNGHRMWKETDAHGQTITYEAVEETAPRRLVTRIADENLPFGGSWTFELAPASDGTQLTITENGEVYNPIFRFVSRFVMGHHATLDAYFAALQKRV